MSSISLEYGKQKIDAELPENWKGDLIDSAFAQSKESLAEMVKTAMSSPEASVPLGRIVKPGETVCVVFSDITRSWQRTDIYLPLIVEELENTGIRPEDITLLSALGTHRKHSEDEKKQLTGSLYGKYRIIDHDCDDTDNLVEVGTTSRGTVVEINRAAAEADRLILTGGIVFHLMAGYSAGRKSLVPGISSRKTIMMNHSLSLAPEKGKGSHPLIGCDKIIDNPLHEDLMEAQEFIKPDFLVNILPGKGAPGGAVAGHYLKAHEKGCRMLREFFLINIDKKRPVVIASAGGFPGDINFYQSVKSMINACQALEDGGTLILATRSQEGLGNPLMEEMLADFTTMAERENFLRENYTIGRFIAYYGCELASKFKTILVSEMNEPSLKNAGIENFKSLQDAVDLVSGRTDTAEVSYWLIPDAAHTFPKAGSEC